MFAADMLASFLDSLTKGGVMRCRSRGVDLQLRGSTLVLSSSGCGGTEETVFDDQTEALSYAAAVHFSTVGWEPSEPARPRVAGAEPAPLPARGLVRLMMGWDLADS